MSLTLIRAVSLFLGQHSKNTANSYKYVLIPMCEYIGGVRPLADVGPDHLLEYIQHVRTKPGVKSPETVNKQIKTIRVFFNWCIRGGIFPPPSPALVLKYNRTDKAIDRIKAMPDHLYEQLLAYARYNPRYHALVLFIGDTGCRIGGAAALQWSDIDFDQRRAVVTEKGQPPRPVFFGNECARVLMKWRSKHTMKHGTYVFQKDGKRMLNNSLGLLFERICHRAEIGQWGPHSLRHRKGFQFSDNSLSISVASMAMGHKSPTTTLEHYYPRDWERVQEAMEKLAHHQPEETPKKVLKFRKN